MQSYVYNKEKRVLTTNDVPFGTASIASKAVTAAKIADATITATQLASNAVTTAKINNSAVTTAKLAAGIVTMTRTQLFSNSSGTAANITVSQAFNNFDVIEFWITDTNTTPNQLIRTVPGTALAVVLDIPHPGGSNTLYWNIARWTWSSGGTTLTLSANHYQKIIKPSSVENATANYIKITKIIGVKYVSHT